MVKTRKQNYFFSYETEDSLSPSSSAPPSQSSSSPPPCSSCPDWSILSCSICQEFPRISDPQSVVVGCRNGHLVCTRCANLMTNKMCPSCRSPMDMSIPSSLIRRMMVSSSGVSVSCFYGCGLAGSMDVIVDHERSCKLGIVECQYQLCMQKVRLEILDSHMQKCFYRPIKCPHCRHFIQSSEWITAHPGCFSDNIVRISIDEDNFYSDERLNYVLLGNDGSNQAFAVINTSFRAMRVEVIVYGLENLGVHSFFFIRTHL